MKVTFSELQELVEETQREKEVSEYANVATMFGMWRKILHCDFRKPSRRKT